MLVLHVNMGCEGGWGRRRVRLHLDVCYDVRGVCKQEDKIFKSYYFILMFNLRLTVLILLIMQFSISMEKYNEQKYISLYLYHFFYFSYRI